MRNLSSMKVKLYIKCQLAWLLIFAVNQFYGLKLYSEDEVHEYSCNFRFDQPVRIGCACVEGLWILYDSCESENITLAGDKHHCLKLSASQPVSRGVQLLKSKEQLAALESDGSVTHLTERNDKRVIIDRLSALVTGAEWVIVDASGARICLAVLEPDSYCFYSNMEDGYWEIVETIRGCEGGYDYFVDPFKCETIGKETVDRCEHSGVKRRFKRQDDAAAEGGGGGATDAGAAGGGGGSANLTDEITPDDEDYLAYNASLEAGNNTDKSPISIASGIMDYMGKHLDAIMQLGSFSPVMDSFFVGRNIPDINSRGGNPLNVTYTNPVYEFLELSKRITQKTCPEHYVKAGFLNLAVATFINMQIVRFKFPEQSFRPSGFRRVLNYLRLCEANAIPFNFTDKDCDGKVDGNYSMFGQILELTITSEFADFNRDPIVETVWKVFFNAHSYCYPFFNKTLDHHRFASWMIPLFQNEMNALWLAGNTTETSLSGMFGNQIEVQGNLAYCAASSRLESKYPWDLPRPSQIAEMGGGNKTEGAEGGGDGGGGAPPAEPPPDSRKKRDITLDFAPEDEDLDSLGTSLGTCVDASKPMLCPTHIQSIIPPVE